MVWRSAREAGADASTREAGDRLETAEADAAPIRRVAPVGVSALARTRGPTGRRTLAGGNVSCEGALGDREARGAWGDSGGWGDWGRALPGAEKLWVCMGHRAAGDTLSRNGADLGRRPRAVSCMALSPIGDR